MITAREALQLPSARLSDDDAAVVAEIMERIDVLVRREFRRAPLRIPVAEAALSPVVAAEITQRCRRAGWRVGWEQQAGVSAITRQQTITGVYLILEPGLGSYIADRITMGAGDYEALCYYQSQFGTNIGVDMFALAHREPWERA